MKINMNRDTTYTLTYLLKKTIIIHQGWNQLSESIITIIPGYIEISRATLDHEVSTAFYPFYSVNCNDVKNRDDCKNVKFCDPESISRSVAVWTFTFNYKGVTINILLNLIFHLKKKSDWKVCIIITKIKLWKSVNTFRK